MVKKVLIFLVFMPLVLFSQKKTTREEYILKYKDIAIRQMKTYGVPASIILAQGLLESDNGNSTLAVNANNHFGIKCHKSWEGPVMYHDDDKNHECFRKYKDAERSYIDHSDFLRGSRRYAPLFDLEPTDYQGWAHGLKKAGYATNPRYAEMLIKIIDENKLYNYDKGIEVEVASPTKGMHDLVDVDNFTIDLYKQRKVYIRNRIKYIQVNEGDTYDKLTTELDLMPWQLAKYNNITRDTVLRVGMELFIQPKRCRAERNHSIHIAEKGESIYLISQMYGVKVKSLYRKNRMKPGDELSEGQKVYLRKKKPLTR